MNSTPSATPLQPIKWNAHFWNTFNFWWSAGLVDGLEPHPPPVSSPKNEMLIFWLCSTSDDWPGWLMDSNPICHPSPANKMKCFFLDYVHFWWSARLVDGLKPRLPPLSSQRNEMLIFVLHSTFDDWSGWSMDSNPIHHSSPAKKNEMLIFGLCSLLMISLADWWTWTPSATPLHQKNEMLIFVLHSTSDDWLGLSMDLNPIHHLSPPKKMKCSYFDYVQLLMIGQAGQWTQTPSTTCLQPKKWNAHFWILFNFSWFARLVDGLKPHPPPSPAKRMKCSFLDYAQLLMISRAVRWTQTPSATPLQPIKWNAHFWITFNFWWSAGLVDGLEPHPPPVSSQKMKCSYFDYVQLLMIGRTGQWTQTPSTTPLQPKKWNAHFCITFNFWCWPPHPPPLSSQ